ncbi:hypothetical protein N7463_010048 [Penicillium fimorum]|uniref:Uncharacterized protein n=1 Tax=Penicillium fimorum TaxID=1882269 RepID=A0A9X0C120_9EURO|nr:hypothetical protein N7463_010048 [Penicillium fimorum]
MSQSSISNPRRQRSTHVTSRALASLIKRVILSAGAMRIFSVYFQLTICPEGQNVYTWSSI